MMMNALRQPNAEIHPHPAHRVHSVRSKVVCFYCYQTLGVAATAQKQAELRHAHDCPEARMARQPDAPPPYN